MLSSNFFFGKCAITMFIMTNSSYRFKPMTNMQFAHWWIFYWSTIRFNEWLGWGGLMNDLVEERRWDKRNIRELLVFGCVFGNRKCRLNFFQKFWKHKQILENRNEYGKATILLKTGMVRNRNKFIFFFSKSKIDIKTRMVGNRNKFTFFFLSKSKIDIRSLVSAFPAHSICTKGLKLNSKPDIGINTIFIFLIYDIVDF